MLHRPCLGCCTPKPPPVALPTSRRLVWVPDAGGSDAVTSIGCSYKQISMHAISRDPEAACAKPCVYLQLDEGSEGGMPGGGDEDEDEEEEEDAAELRLIPADDSQGARVCWAQVCSPSTACTQSRSG